VDPAFQLIKGGGACHVQEKLVAVRAKRFVVVVDSTKLVDTLNLGFLLPVEVLPGAWRQVQGQLAAGGPVAGQITTGDGQVFQDADGHRFGSGHARGRRNAQAFGFEVLSQCLAHARSRNKESSTMPMPANDLDPWDQVGVALPSSGFPQLGRTCTPTVRATPGSCL
jgi:hypothetical protein